MAYAELMTYICCHVTRTYAISAYISCLSNQTFEVNSVTFLSQHGSQKEELIQVLRRATMPDRTVILTMVDESSASPRSMLDVLLQSFKSGEGTQRLLSHLVIITMDPQAFEYCRSLHHPHCIHPSTFAPYFDPKRQTIPIPDHSVFSWRRNNVLIEVLELGYNIIFTVWMHSDKHESENDG